MKQCRISSFRKLLIFLIFCSFITSSHSQWERVPALEGGVVFSVTADNNMIFAPGMPGVSVLKTDEAEPPWETIIVPPIPEITALACYNDSIVTGTPAGIYISSTEHPELIDMQKNPPRQNIAGLSINTGHLPAGMYFLKLTHERINIT
jgi:hypothetical protein